MEKYTSTLLPQDNTPQENQKAILDLLAKLNETAAELETLKQAAASPSVKEYWQLLFTDVVSTTSTSYVDIPGFTLTFTPKTEKIKITVLSVIGVSGAQAAYSRTLLNGTPVYIGRTDAGYNTDGSIDYYEGSADANNNQQNAVIGIFSCNKNTSNTVQIQWRAEGIAIRINTLGSNISGTSYATRCSSSILVEEV